MTKTEKLLEEFLTEGMSSIRAVHKQLDKVQRDITDLKVDTATIQEHLSNRNEVFSERENRRIAKEKELKAIIEKNKDKIDLLEKENNKAEVEKHVIDVNSTTGQERQERLENEVVEIAKRIGALENQQNKWLGAIAILVFIIGVVAAATNQWFSSWLGLIFLI